MAERPPIEAKGRIVKVHEANRLYEVEMENGHHAYAVLAKGGPFLPEGIDPSSCEAVVHFSPFDMT